eukprot:PITA_30825
MLHMFVMQQPHKWEDYLHLVEFSYNNGHHESLGMSPFEVLYGRKCRVPVDWNNPVNKLALGPDMLSEMEEVVKKVRKNLRAAQNRQKMYADKKRTYREIQPGDHIYPRIKPQKSSLQCRGCAKVILEGEFLAEPLRILDQRETTLRKRVITQVKVQWKHFGPDEATWEEEDFMREAYLTLFP